MADIIIYTDGACSGNPGPGGWGAILVHGENRKELSGGEPETTNNRMELQAAIEALGALKRPCKVAVYTDSVYVRDGITKWIQGWQRNGWRTAAKKPVKNVELWQALQAALQQHDVDWHWVKGHAGPSGERTRRRTRAYRHGAVQIQLEHVSLRWKRLMAPNQFTRLGAKRSAMWCIGQALQQRRWADLVHEISMFFGCFNQKS